MALSKLNKSNITSQSWQNIYTTINNRTYIPDPVNASGVRKFVYTREPNIKDTKFQGFPFIVVNPASIDMDTPSVSRENKIITWTIPISVYSSDKLANGSYPTASGMNFLDSISDDLFETFNSLTVKDQLRTYDVENIDLDTGSVNVDDLEDETVFVRDMTLTINTRLRTT